MSCFDSLDNSSLYFALFPFSIIEMYESGSCHCKSVSSLGYTSDIKGFVIVQEEKAINPNAIIKSLHGFMIYQFSEAKYFVYL